MNILIFGPNGSGKGTQGAIVQKKYGVPHIETGVIFRENISKGTELGKKAKVFIDKGDLVPDDITIPMILDRLQEPDCAKGWLLDGFPRNLAQADALDALGLEGPEVVFDLQVSDETVVARLAGRRTCPSCEAIYHLVNKPPRTPGLCDVCGAALVQRKDDTPEVIKERLKTYHAKTEPLIARYAAKGRLYVIDGNASSEAEIRDVRKVLDALRGAGK
jgi:adenylate kinase